MRSVRKFDPRRTDTIAVIEAGSKSDLEKPVAATSDTVRLPTRGEEGGGHNVANTRPDQVGIDESGLESQLGIPGLSQRLRGHQLDSVTLRATANCDVGPPDSSRLSLRPGLDGAVCKGDENDITSFKLPQSSSSNC